MIMSGTNSHNFHHVLANLGHEIIKDNHASSRLSIRTDEADKLVISQHAFMPLCDDSVSLESIIFWLPSTKTKYHILAAVPVLNKFMLLPKNS